MAKILGLPDIPNDVQLKELIDYTAKNVAEQGPRYEIETKALNIRNSNYDFLKGGRYVDYYRFKVGVEKKKLEMLDRWKTSGMMKSNNESPVPGFQSSLHQPPITESIAHAIFGSTPSSSSHSVPQIPMFGKINPNTNTQHLQCMPTSQQFVSAQTSMNNQNIHTEIPATHLKPIFGVDPSKYAHLQHTHPQLSATGSNDNPQLSLPEKLFNCYGEVILMLNQAGIIQLEGAKEPILCFFHQQDLYGISKIRDGIDCRVNAKLVPAHNRIPKVPYMATSVWIDGDSVPPELISKILKPIPREYIHLYNQLLQKVGKMLPGSKNETNLDAGLDLYDPEDMDVESDTDDQDQFGNNQSQTRQNITRSTSHPTSFQERVSLNEPETQETQTVSHNYERDSRDRRKFTSHEKYKNRHRSRSNSKKTKGKHRKNSRSRSRSVERHRERRNSRSRSRSVERLRERRNSRSRSRSVKRDMKRSIPRPQRNIEFDRDTTASDAFKRETEVTVSQDRKNLITDGRKIPSSETFTFRQESTSSSITESSLSRRTFWNEASEWNNSFNAVNPRIDCIKSFVTDSANSVIVTLDAETFNDGFSENFIQIGASNTRTNNEQKALFIHMRPRSLDLIKDPSNQEKLREKLKLDFNTEGLIFKHPTRGSIKSVHEKDGLERLTRFLKAISLETKRKCILLVHNAHSLFPILLNKLKFYNLFKMFNEAVDGICYLTNLCWNLNMNHLWNERKYPSLEAIFNFVQKDRAFDNSSCQCDYNAFLMGLMLEKMKDNYSRLESMQSFLEQSGYVSLRDFSLKNASQILAVKPNVPKGKISRIVISCYSHAMGHGEHIALDPATSEPDENKPKMHSSAFKEGHVDSKLDTNKGKMHPSFEEEGHIAEALCDCIVETDCELPISLRLKVFIPDGLVLVKRNPHNLSGFAMLPQVVPISNSKVLCKGSSETISTVTVKVSNDGVHAVKINKGDEIGLVRIEKDLGQETPVLEADIEHMDKNTHDDEDVKIILKIQDNKGKRSNSAPAVRLEDDKAEEFESKPGIPDSNPSHTNIVSEISSQQEHKSISDELLDHYKELHGDTNPSSSFSEQDERNLQFQRLRQRFNRIHNKQSHNNWTSDELNN